MAVNHVEQHRGQRLINAQRLRSCFKRLMGPQIAGGKQPSLMTGPLNCGALARRPVAISTMFCSSDGLG